MRSGWTRHVFLRSIYRPVPTSDELAHKALIKIAEFANDMSDHRPYTTGDISKAFARALSPQSPVLTYLNSCHALGRCCV
jgi:hypothetical protein